jgi:hypothetical protein
MNVAAGGKVPYHDVRGEQLFPRILVGQQDAKRLAC